MEGEVTIGSISLIWVMYIFICEEIARAISDSLKRLQLSRSVNDEGEIQLKRLSAEQALTTEDIMDISDFYKSQGMKGPIINITNSFADLCRRIFFLKNSLRYVVLATTATSILSLYYEFKNEQSIFLSELLLVLVIALIIQFLVDRLIKQRYAAPVLYEAVGGIKE